MNTEVLDDIHEKILYSMELLGADETPNGREAYLFCALEFLLYNLQEKGIFTEEEIDTVVGLMAR